MRLLIATTRKDKSCDRIMEECGKKNVEVTRVFYEELRLHELRPEKFREFDFCILRDPYNTGRDFSIYLRTIFRFVGSRVLDCRTYERYPFYEDKLFQHILFRNVMKMPGFWYYNRVNEVDLIYPKIVKKRIGSRGREIFVINSGNEMRKFFGERDVTDYFFEEYIGVEKDVRVIVINNEVIGAVERRVRLKNNNGYTGIGVKVTDRYDIPEDVCKKIIAVSKTIGSDFCGIDFVVDKEGMVYLLECNLSPQFVSLEHVLGINVAERLVEFIMESCKK